MAKKSQPATVKVRQVRSGIGRPRPQREALRSLGLRRIRHVVEREDSPAVRGLIRKIDHLVEVGEATLGNSTHQRHLATFETGSSAVPGARTLALVPTAAGLSNAGPRPTPDSLLATPASGRRLELMQFHRSIPRCLARSREQELAVHNFD